MSGMMYIGAKAITRHVQKPENKSQILHKDFKLLSTCC